jgi:hypothetical protein
MSEPTLVLIGNKLVKATEVLSPKLSITFPQGPARVGELVILEAKLEHEHSSFVKAAKIKWDVREKDAIKQCWTEGKKVIFGAGVGETSISVTATLTLHYDVDGEEVVKQLSAVTTVKPSKHAPLPPVPNSSVASLVADWAKDPNLVPQDEDLIKGAHALSASFKKVSAEISSTGCSGNKEVMDIMLKTRLANNDALSSVGIVPHVWDGWARNVQGMLRDKVNNLELTTLGHYKKLWWEISAGLWMVSKD